jgi:hypothetical protein
MLTTHLTILKEVQPLHGNQVLAASSLGLPLQYFKAQ